MKAKKESGNSKRGHLKLFSQKSKKRKQKEKKSKGHMELQQGNQYTHNEVPGGSKRENSRKLILKK